MILPLRVALLLAFVAQTPDAGTPTPAGTPSVAAAKPLDPFPAGYLGHEALTVRLRALAEANPGIVRLQSIAKTQENRDVWLATLDRRPVGDAAVRPSILIVANLEADHVIGSQVALALLERLAADATAGAEARNWLNRVTVHVVPRLDPDGVETILTAPHAPVRTNLQPIDRDRDARSGEDGPEDLDGDGWITTLRVRDLAANMIADAKDPRIGRKAVATDGEAGVYSEYVEGIDSDRDGSLNEDPPGGVLLNRNWPHRWPEFDREAGPFPASEPETYGLMRFVQAHPEIAVVWAFALEDTLRNEPKKPAAPYDDADLPEFVALHKLYRKALDTAPKGLDVPVPALAEAPADPSGAAALPPEQEPAPAPATASRPLGLEGASEGTLPAWAYQQFGVVGISSRLWEGPDFPEAKGGEPAPPKEGEARWLFWNDRVLAGRGYQPFRTFEHPSLGHVAIGGWKCGVRTNPPAERIEPISGSQLAFLDDLGRRLPRLELTGLRAERRGEGLVEIHAVVRNAGELPTALAQGTRTRQAAPVLVRLDPGAARIVAGQPLERVPSLAGSGGLREFRWVVLVPAEGQKDVTIEAACPKAGRVVHQVALP